VRPRWDQLLLLGQVNNVDAEVLLDTGAQANVIGRSLITKLARAGKPIKTRPCQLDVKGVVSDAPMTVSGLARVDLVLRGEDGNPKPSVFDQITAIVSPQYDGDLILSFGTLSDWGMKLDIAEGGDPLTLAFNKWPGFYPRAHRPSDARVAAACKVRNMLREWISLEPSSRDLRRPTLMQP
jgi:hypothetical protein